MCTTVILVLRKIGLGDLHIEANLSYKMSPPPKKKFLQALLVGSTLFWFMPYQFGHFKLLGH